VKNKEVQLRMKDGTVRPYLASASLIELGGEPCVISITRDISALKEVERKLRERERSLRRIFETSLDAISISRLSDGKYVDVNQEFLKWGYSRSRVLGSTDRELNVWCDENQRLEFLARLGAEGQVRNMEVELRRLNGTTVPCLLSAATVELDGELCVVSFTRDITRLKKA